MPEQSNEFQLVPEAACSMDIEDENLCPTLTFDDNEQKIVNATIAAFQTGSLTPLIKEELRCTIQSRRLAEGKGEMTVEFKTPVKKKDMTDDERKKALKRREQNREAAQRFRQRQKDTGDYLSAKISRLQHSSDSLLKNLDELRKERDELQEMLSAHLCICSRSTSSTSNSTGLNLNRLLQEIGITPEEDSTSPTTCELSPTSYELSPTTGDLSSTTCDLSPDNSDRESPEIYTNTECSQTQTVHVIEPNDELFQMLESSKGFCFAEEGAPCEEDVEVYYDETPTEVCYEEVVMDTGDSDCYTDKHRLDSCSSEDTYATYDSFASETPSLSESTSDLRNSISSAYSRVIVDSCSSVPFDASYYNLDQDFLLPEDAIS